MKFRLFFEKNQTISENSDQNTPPNVETQLPRQDKLSEILFQLVGWTVGWLPGGTVGRVRMDYKAQLKLDFSELGNKLNLTESSEKNICQDFFDSLSAVTKLFTSETE